MLNRSRNAIFPIVAMIVAVTTVCLGSSSSNQHSGGVADAQSLHTYRAFARSPAQVADSNDPWDAVTKPCQNLSFRMFNRFSKVQSQRMDVPFVRRAATARSYRY